MSQNPRRADLGRYEAADPRTRRREEKRRRKRRNRLWFRIGVGAVAFLLILCSIYNYIFAKMTTLPLEESAKELSVQSAPRGGVTNIALLGIDTWEDIKGRSDAVLILSLDQKNHTMKLTSILRDSYLPIPGHKKDKLTHAYAYGGAALTIQTLNQNFGLDIKDYVALNFADLEQIIDAVGGIPMEISEKERKEINRIIQMDHPDEAELTENGTVTLSGRQATAYARSRKIDTDEKRASRQRDVLQALFTACKAKSIFSYPKLAHDILSHVTTSLTPTQITSLALSSLSTDLTPRQYSVPSDEDNAKGGVYGGMWVWRYDIDNAAKNLRAFIYE